MQTLTPKVQQWLDLVKHQPVAFGLEAGFDKLTDLHNEWLKLFLYSRDDMTLQAHRGSFKTTCLSIAIALLIILFPDKKIIFLRKGQDDVKEIITQVANLLRSEFYQALAHILYGVTLELVTESVFEIDTNLNKTASGTSQLIGIGTGGSLTGKHADIVITDDIINRKDRTSEAERNTTKEIYQELQNVKNRGGRILNTGTPWHKDDAFSIMPKPVTYDCYKTGLMSDEDIEALRTSMTPSLFAANYELKHIASGDAIFDRPQIDDGTNTHLIYNGICHVDAAYGGSDSSAFTVMKEQPDGKLYVYGELRGAVSDSVLFFEAARKRYRAGTLHIERNGNNGGYVAKEFSNPVREYNEHMNKFVKITTHLKSRWKDVVFIKDTDPKYIDQITEYTEYSKHDDAPDSLASLIRESSQGHVVQLFRQGI